MIRDSARSGMPHFFLNALRIVAALLFMQHGAQKLFAMFGWEEAVELFSLIGIAGVLELWGGLLLLLGLFTRPVAFILAGEMAAAYFLAHAPQGRYPILNAGELAALYCFIFLFLAANGGGAFSVDGFLAARRRSSLA